MPNVVTVLKQEISRISRKEAKAAVTPLRKPSVRARKDIADLKRRLALLEKTNKELQARLAKVEGVQPVAPESDKKARITAKGLRSLRRKLGLSQAELGRLIGISGQAVAHSEKQDGALKVRANTRAAILSIRDLGAREAKKLLEEMGKKQPVKKPKREAGVRRGRAKRRGK